MSALKILAHSIIFENFRLSLRPLTLKDIILNFMVDEEVSASQKTGQKIQALALKQSLHDLTLYVVATLEEWKRPRNTLYLGHMGTWASLSKDEVQLNAFVSRRSTKKSPDIL